MYLKSNDLWIIVLVLYCKLSPTETIRYQFFEQTTVLENSPLNTVIFDIRTAWERHSTSPLPPNATAYANQQETFWPFVLDRFLIKIGRPLDRESLCIRRDSSRTILHSVDSPTKSLIDTTDGCPIGACCHLLHVNIVSSPTELPKPFYVQVAVQDVNDNAPRFPNLHTPYTIVREDIKMTDKIWLPQAYDPDSLQYGIAEYRISAWIQGNESHFRLGIADPEDLSFHGNEYDYSTSSVDKHSMVQIGRPYLVPSEPLDRETIDLYAFTLLAIDGSSSIMAKNSHEFKSLTGTANIVIKIADVNDNKPLFNSKIYKPEIVENSMNSQIFEFQIIDKDIGENGRVSVNIDDPLGQAQHLFRVVTQPAKSGLIRTNFANQPGSYYKGFLQLISHLDAERYAPMLRFNLIATDHGQPVLSSKAEVHLRIININDNAPNIVFLSHGKRLADGRLSLPEIETLPRVVVALVQVTDEDSRVEQLRCHLTREEDMFSFEEADGLNTYLHQSQLQIPFFGDSVGIQSSYRQFVIRTKKALDREQRSFYIVTVECVDDEGAYALHRNASLHITVTDLNDHSPVFDKKSYKAQVVENVARAEVHLVSPMHVTDPDLGPNALITYSIYDLNQSILSDPTNMSAYFRIDSTSGRIWSLFALDCENQSDYDVVVVAQDAGSPQSRSSSAIIHITVEDANDNVPEFINTHYLFEVPENSPGGTEIGMVEAVDKDKTLINQRVHYNLRGSPEDLRLITIDRNSGLVRTRRPIDRESRSSISLIVEAENEIPLQMPTLPRQDHRTMGKQIGTEASLVITILNRNDNRPEFTLIEPHRSHVVFIWEQLDPLNKALDMHSNSNTSDLKNTKHGLNESSSTSVFPSSSNTNLFGNKLFSPKNVNPVCEPLPHRVIDRDVESDHNFDCCIMELLDNFNGLFTLMPEAPSVICAMYRPPVPQSYKLTLIAKDGSGNDSLSSQVHFTVIIRSDPTLRSKDGREPTESGIDQALGELSRFPTKLGSGIRSHKRPNQDRWIDELTNNPNNDYGSSLGNDPNLGQSIVSKYGTTKQTSYGQQTLIIIVMASIAGVLCVLLLLAIILTKRCGFDSKEFVKDQESPNETAMVPKGSGSVHSTPSNTKISNPISLSFQPFTSIPDYCTQGMIYHHPMSPTSNDSTYDVTLRTRKTPNPNLVSLNLYPTLNSPTLRPQQSHGNHSNHHANNMSLGSRSARPNLLKSAMQSPNILNTRTNNLRNYSQSKENTDTLGPSVQSLEPSHAWPPLPSAPQSAALGLPPMIPNNQLSKQNLPPCYGQSIYQTIDTRLFPNPTSGSMTRDRMAKSPFNIGKVHFEETKAALFAKGSQHKINNLTNPNSISLIHGPNGQDEHDNEGDDRDDDDTEFEKCCSDNQFSSDYVQAKPSHAKLQRTNSERGGNYCQASFV